MGTGHIARTWEKVLVGSLEGKRPLGRPVRKWQVDIDMRLTEVGWEGVDWIELAQDRDQWRALVNLRELKQD
jgi:hypothetical protein